MTAGLLLGILGLALLDSLNPATIVSVALILLSGIRRPGASALGVVVGAAVTVFAAGALIFLSAGAAADLVAGGVVWLRRIAFGAAAIALLVVGIRRLRDRERRMISLPAWFSPWTALPFGVLVTGADLPNAFPYFIAIERLVASDVEVLSGLAVIAGYAVVYCLPCLVLLVAGLAFRDRVAERLDRVRRRFGEGVVKRSVPAAIGFWVASAAVLSIAVWP